jgi:hypothetical protein
VNSKRLARAEEDVRRTGGDYTQGNRHGLAGRLPSNGLTKDAEEVIVSYVLLNTRQCPESRSLHIISSEEKSKRALFRGIRAVMERW